LAHVILGLCWYSRWSCKISGKTFRSFPWHRYYSSKESWCHLSHC